MASGGTVRLLNDFPHISYCVVQKLGPEAPPHQCYLLDPHHAERENCVETSSGHLFPGKTHGMGPTFPSKGLFSMFFSLHCLILLSFLDRSRPFHCPHAFVSLHVFSLRTLPVTALLRRGTPLTQTFWQSLNRLHCW